MLKDVPDISLQHGQGRWVLQNCDLTSRESDQSFDTLPKSLRRGAPPLRRMRLAAAQDSTSSTATGI